MLHFETLLYLASVILQVAALAFCGLMARRNSMRGPWLIMSTALSAMLLFRVVGLLISGPAPMLHMSADASDVFGAVISTIISLLLFLALFSIRRLSLKQQEAAAAQLSARADAERRSSELDAVIGNMPDGVYIGTAAGITKCNRPAMQMLGFDGNGDLRRPVPALADAIQTRFADTGQRIPPGSEPFERALAGEATVREVVARNLRSGQDVFIRCAAAPIFRDGQVVAAVAVNTDITESKHAEEHHRDLLATLEKQTRIFNTTLSSITDFAYIFDRDGRFIYANQPLLDLWGLTLDDAAGRNFFDLKYPDELAAKLQRQIQQVVDTARPLTDETPYTSPTGAGGIYEYIFSPVMGADGRVEVVAGSTRDITARKQHEAERERLVRTLDNERARLAAIIEQARLSEVNERAARAEAERANEAKNEFIAVLSHELRTPLTPVLLTISLMESRPDLSDDARQDVATIRRNVELESRLISDLLDLTRIARGKLQLVMEVVDAHLLIRSAIDICLREDSVPLETKLEAAHYHVRADGTRLQQIIWNQINNAIRHGGPGVQVVVRTSNTTDGRLRIEVIDNGEGIDPAVLPKLFTAFEQGEVRTKRQFAGLGLGLAISEKLVEAHGGTIAAYSEGRGKGATFVIELPTVHVPARSPDEAGGAATAASQPIRSLKVLLVEDNEPTLRVLTKLLERLGHRVTMASSVADGIAASSRGEYDVLLSDLGLPDGSGLDLMRRLSNRFTGKAIALTGYGMENDIRACLEAGFTEHLTKPVNMETLLDALRRVTA
jgi:two-component system CheB/CheR fusion protein